jgi:hypothetical protein
LQMLLPTIWFTVSVWSIWLGLNLDFGWQLLESTSILVSKLLSFIGRCHHWGRRNKRRYDSIVITFWCNF